MFIVYKKTLFKHTNIIVYKKTLFNNSSVKTDYKLNLANWSLPKPPNYLKKTTITINSKFMKFRNKDKDDKINLA